MIRPGRICRWDACARRLLECWSERPCRPVCLLQRRVVEGQARRGMNEGGGLMASRKRKGNSGAPTQGQRDPAARRRPTGYLHVCCIFSCFLLIIFAVFFLLCCAFVLWIYCCQLCMRLEVIGWMDHGRDTIVGTWDVRMSFPALHMAGWEK